VVEGESADRLTAPVTGREYVESYRLSSKLSGKNREYLIQTSNDVNVGEVSTTVCIDGVPAETALSPHPPTRDNEEILSYVRAVHNEKKDEISRLLRAHRKVRSSSDSQEIFHLGVAFFYRRFFREAGELFVSVSKLNHKNHQAYNFLGMTELMLGNAERAVTAANMAVSLSPGYADYRNNLGEALLELQNFEMAIAEFEKAIEINVYYGVAYFNLGLARLSNLIASQGQDSATDQLIQIEDFFHRSSLVETNFRGQPYEEGISFLKDGKLQEALRVLKCIREEKKISDQRGQSSFQQKFLLYPDWVSPEVIDERIGFLQDDLKANPSYIDLHVELAQCYLEQARLAWEKGIRELRTTSELNPAIESVTSSLRQADNVHDDMLTILRPLMERG